MDGAGSGIHGWSDDGIWSTRSQPVFGHTVVAEGGRESDAAMGILGELCEASELTEELGSAIAANKRMNFVDDDKTKIAKDTFEVSMFVN